MCFSGLGSFGGDLGVSMGWSVVYFRELCALGCSVAIL